VRERTRELDEANRRLQAEMEERARLESEMLDLSQREQERLGRDLHDSLGQKLTGAVYLSRALLGQLPDAAAEARDATEKINALLKEAVGQVRMIARGLAPIQLGEDGLPDALRRLAADSASVFGLSCSYEGGPSFPLNSTAAHHLYHIAQESVHNAIRHGLATRIILRLRRDGPLAELQVEDNGRGLAATAPSSGGMGLRIMRYRADLIGGRLELLSQPGGGTIVSCRFNENRE
jgi:signal transduction histidine kinase